MPKYNMRVAQIQDVEKIVAVLKDAFNESPYVESHSYSEERVRKLASDILGMGINNGYILLAEVGAEIVGIFSGLKTYTTMGLEETAVELVWWVRQDFRKSRLAIELVRAFEYWSDRIGVTRIILGNMNNTHMDTTERFYIKSGYKLTEKTYMKEVK